MTEGRNENRLRLSAIVPRIINCEGKNITEISVLLEKLYTSRNKFLHADQSSYYSRRDEDIEYLEKITARVILRCFELGKSIDGVGERRTKAWSKLCYTLRSALHLGVKYKWVVINSRRFEKDASFQRI